MHATKSVIRDHVALSVDRLGIHDPDTELTIAFDRIARDGLPSRLPTEGRKIAQEDTVLLAAHDAITFDREVFRALVLDAGPARVRDRVATNDGALRAAEPDAGSAHVGDDVVLDEHVVRERGL